MSDTSTELRERIVNIVLNRGNGWTYVEIADAVMREIGDISRLAPGGNYPPADQAVAAEEPLSEDGRLLRVDPENLVVVETGKLGRLFDLHYPALKERAAELLDECTAWREAHRTPKGGIIPVKDDAENGDLGDRIKKMDAFGDEVEVARKKVKVAVFNAGQVIDGWFARGLVAPIMEVRGVPAKVGGKVYKPGPETMDGAQTAYMLAKLERERLDRERIAREAQEAAAQKADEARKVAAEESARATTFQETGLAPEDAHALAEVATDQAAEAADAAQQQSALLGSRAAEVPREAVRQHTASGTTVGLGGRWTFEAVSMIDLCLAVGAPALLRPDLRERVAASAQVGHVASGAVLTALAQILTPGGVPVPPNFVTTDDKVIRAAITARTMPLRECPGLRVYQELSAQRRGAR